MLKKIVLASFAAALLVLTLPAVVGAYGACHVGYTHAGPNGVYHSGATVATGPDRAYGAERTTAYGAGGAAYGVHYSTGSSNGQLYAPTHAAGYANTSTYNYSYVR